MQGIAEAAYLVGGEDLVGGRGAVGEGGGEVEEVFEEDFYGGEAGGGCCGELGGDLVDPSTLYVLVGGSEGAREDLRLGTCCRLLVCTTWLYLSGI